MAWAAIGLLAATLAVLTTALFQLRGEFRLAFGELRQEMREGFRTQGLRIDALAARIDAHVDRHTV